MYYIIDSETGNRHPCAVAPRATIRNLREVFSMLDKGVEPGVAHVVFPTGETLDVEVPLRYRLNSLGREAAIIGGNLLFQKRLEIDIEHLARFQWGEGHKWDQGTMGIWWEAAGITDTSKPVDDETIERLHEAFPKTSLRGIVDRYRAQHYGHPTPSIYTLIDLALKANRPLTDQRPSKSGIAIEFKDNEYGRMGIARDKRTGQTWMWPLEEENDSNEEFGMAPDDLGDAFVPYRDSDGHKKSVEDMVEETSEANRKLGYCPTWVGPTTRRLEYGLDRYKAHRLEKLDRRDIKRALDEELRRGGLPDTFRYPCHTDEGTVWCDWDCTQDRTEIMLKTKPTKPGTPRETNQVGWLNRKTDDDGLRWWWWEDMEGREGKRLPSYQQALLDFIETTKE